MNNLAFYKITKSLLVFICSVIFLTFGHAQSLSGYEQDCYEKFGLEKAPQDAHLYILIDQTLQLDREVQGRAIKRVTDFLQPGLTISIYDFSTDVGGRYSKEITKLELNHELKWFKGFILGLTNSKKDLNEIKECLKEQEKIAKNTITEAFSYAFQEAKGGIPRSEILYNLKEISKSFSRNPIEEKYVLVVSDMIENSNIASFYNNKILKDINPEEEIKNIREEYIQDFKQAHIYVMGGGFGQEETLLKDNLETFWEIYFEEANANLVEFGKPLLLNPMKRK